MFIFDKWVIKFFSNYVGFDEYGNQYYESKKSDNYGNKRRYIIYNNIVDPSNIPVIWHSWLHHMSLNAPVTEGYDKFEVFERSEVKSNRSNIIDNQKLYYKAWSPRSK